jgi:hypothetical protein
MADIISISVDRVHNAEIVQREIMVDLIDQQSATLPVLVIASNWKPRKLHWGSVQLYTLEEIPVGNGFDGRGFTLRKDDGEHYSCFIAANGQDSHCDCPGGTYAHRCKHVDAIRELIVAGRLDDPRNPPVETAVNWDDCPF